MVGARAGRSMYFKYMNGGTCWTMVGSALCWRSRCFANTVHELNPLLTEGQLQRGAVRSPSRWELC